MLSLQIRDSKDLGEEERIELYKQLTSHPRVAWGVAAASAQRVDEVNVQQVLIKCFTFLFILFLYLFVWYWYCIVYGIAL